jgi:hypothetical protein
MNWPEFVAECEELMTKAGVDPTKLAVRVEVSDSHYDTDVKPGTVHLQNYWGKSQSAEGYTMRLVIWGD